MSAERLPWHDAQWRSVEALRAQDRMPHALLLRGPEGVGKHAFAQRLANWVLCERAPSQHGPCGACQSCRWYQAGTHPDLWTAAPLEGKSGIGIAQIRELIGYVGLTRHRAPYKVVLIDPADALTREAANSLLKTLEEPPAGVVFLLLAQRNRLLPATVRSRCQSFDFPVPPPAGSLEWLRERLAAEQDPALLLDLAQGAPLRALALAESELPAQRASVFRDLSALLEGEADPVVVAGGWRSLGAASVVHWLGAHVTDLIRLKSAGDARIVSQDLREAMQRAVERLDLICLFRLLDRCTEVRRAFELRLNLNEQLVLEDIAVACRTQARR